MTPATSTITRDGERQRILASFALFNVPPNEQQEILEALDSPRWDWFTQTDGCTWVSELYWPTKYFPPCVRHDYDWFVGNPVWESNLRFYRLSRRYGLSRLRASLRLIGVTIGWYGYFKWKHMLDKSANRRSAPCLKCRNDDSAPQGDCT